MHLPQFILCLITQLIGFAKPPQHLSIYLSRLFKLDFVVVTVDGDLLHFANSRTFDAALNFVRVAAWLEGQPLAKTRVSKFAALRSAA